MAEEPEENVEGTPEEAAASETPDPSVSEPAAPSDAPTEEPVAEEALAEDAAAEAPEDSPAAEEAAEAPAAEEAAEAATPKERRRRARAAKAAAAPVREQRTHEERQAERDAQRRRKATVRSARRLRLRQKASAKRAETPAREPLAPRVEQHPGQQKTRQGIVVSDRAAKTITVRIDVARRHPRYEKIVRTSRTLHAHDEQGEAHVGDTVIVRECRPMSRTKRWRLVEVVERAK
jgi:small subunit ribosomal protein S17